MSAHNRRNLKEFQRYSSRLNRMIEDGSLEGGGRSRLVSKVRSLYQGLLGIVPEKTLRSILAAGAVVVIGLSTACGDGKKTDTDTATDMTSDTVTDIVEDTGTDMPLDTVPDVDPDGDPDVTPDTTPDVDPDVEPDVDPDVDPDMDPDMDPDVMPDMDPDADPDVVPDADPDVTDVIDEDVTALTPSFGTAQTDPFGLVAPTLGWEYSDPALADIDDDGDLDLFLSTYNEDLLFFENTGTPTAPAFAAATTNPFGFVASYYSEGITIGDLDDDGDLDLFIADYDYGGYGYNFLVWENAGTASAPSFGTPEMAPYGLPAPTDDYIFPHLLDLDGDLDLDMLSAEYGILMYYENTGTVSAPAFGAGTSDPFGLAPGTWVTVPASSDLDFDGDLDLLLGVYGSTAADLLYYENTGTASAPAFTGPSTNPFGLTPTYMYANIEFGDLDADGDDDILISGYYASWTYFENTTL